MGLVMLVTQGYFILSFELGFERIERFRFEDENEYEI